MSFYRTIMTLALATAVMRIQAELKNTQPNDIPSDKGAKQKTCGAQFVPPEEGDK